MLGIVVCEKNLDRIYVKLKEANNGKGQPEFRLPILIVGAFALPPVITAYAWVAELHCPLPALLAVVGVMGFIFLLAFLPLMAYVVDAFGLFSASAMTSVIVIRCLCGTFLPLVSSRAIKAFGIGRGLTLFSACAMCFTPLILVVYRYGARLRQRSTYTRDV